MRATSCNKFNRKLDTCLGKIGCRVAYLNNSHAKSNPGNDMLRHINPILKGGCAANLESIYDVAVGCTGCAATWGDISAPILRSSKTTALQLTLDGNDEFPVDIEVLLMEYPLKGFGHSCSNISSEGESDGSNYDLSNDKDKQERSVLEIEILVNIIPRQIGYTEKNIL